VAHDDYAHEFDTMFANMARRSRSDCHVPNTDVYVDPDGAYVVVQMEIAGVDRETLTVAADDRALYITGTRNAQTLQRSASCLLKEIEYGAFERKVHLPFAIDHAATKANYEDGILTIELPAIASEIPTIVRTEIRLIF
jgi:HSP20 family molecular chaperone IbpA